MLVVLNEWIFHDLSGDNGEHAQSETYRFLSAFATSGHRLVVPENACRWMNKAYRLMMFVDPNRRRASRLFFSLFSDADRAIRVPSGTDDDAASDAFSSVPAKDSYLVSAYLFAGADTLVTTDEKLRSVLNSIGDISCQMREDFLSAYLG